MSSGFIGLDSFIKKTDKRLDKYLRDVVQLAFMLLMKNSPVLYGNYRGNWLGSSRTPRVGNPKNYGQTGGSDTGGTIQSQRNTNAGVAKGDLPTSFEKSNLAPALNAKFGEIVYITNNLEYATSVENRHGTLHVSAQQTRAMLS